jgi:hypothetical protein
LIEYFNLFQSQMIINSHLTTFSLNITSFSQISHNYVYIYLLLLKYINVLSSFLFIYIHQFNSTNLFLYFMLNLLSYEMHQSIFMWNSYRMLEHIKVLYIHLGLIYIYYIHIWPYYAISLIITMKGLLLYYKVVNQREMSKYAFYKIIPFIQGLYYHNIILFSII